MVVMLFISDFYRKYDRGEYFDDQQDINVYIDDSVKSDNDKSEAEGASAVEKMDLKNLTIYKDIQYTSVSGVDKKYLSLDLYLPKADKKTPTLIWIHGGGWIEGSKNACANEARTFAKNGYAMACINYRLAEKIGNKCSSNLKFPAAIHDVKSAVRFLRKNADKYNLDSNKFAAIGASSGAHLASLLGVSYGDKYLQGSENPGYSDKVQAVVDWYGPVDVMTSPPDIIFKEDACTTDLSVLDKKYGGEATKYFYWNRAWSQFLGGGLGDSKTIKQAKLATPLTYLDKNDPPFLIIHGQKDGMIPDKQSKIFADALKKAGIEVSFKNPVNAGHGHSDGDKILPSFFTPTIKFLDAYLK